VESGYRQPVATGQPHRSAAWLRPLLLAVALSLGSPMHVLAAASPEDVVRQVDAGRFREAEAAIAGALADPALEPQARRALEFERERMRRIRLDFSLDREAVLAQLRRHIPDLR
jgi:hypothetical protein